MTDTAAHTPDTATGPALRPAGVDYPEFLPGWVWLVGAGPGDPGLLTLYALQALQQADVIVYDALVDDRILALAPPATERLYAGKRGGRPSAKQADISETLVALARSGRRVLRLKGGDPFVFGRGAEECQFLHAHGIPFRVVSGITAGIGGLAAAGIPATVRETNAAITFITGHAANGEVPDSLNWNALAHASPVLVFYMGLKHLPVIVDRLVAAGRSADTPAAAVAEATTPRQRVVTATLGTLVEAIRTAGLHPPAIVVVGEVVSLRQIIAAGARQAGP
ncbi:uroporphyrinogen-III C-methyltransferase [Novispirillum itersonii]